METFLYILGGFLGLGFLSMLIQFISGYLYEIRIRKGKRIQEENRKKSVKMLILKSVNNNPFVNLQLEVGNKKEHSIKQLNRLQNANHYLNMLNNTINEDIKNNGLRRNQSDLLGLDKPEETLNSNNLTKTKFILNENDETSPFYFSVINFFIPKEEEGFFDSFFGKNSKSELRFTIAYMPQAIDNRSEIRIGEQTIEETMSQYEKWKYIVFMYDNFQFDSKEGDGYFDAGQQLLLEHFLNVLEVKLNGKRNSRNNAKIDQHISFIGKIKSSLKSATKRMIQIDLKKLRDDLIWLGKDFVWEIIKEIAMGNIPFLN